MVKFRKQFSYMNIELIHILIKKVISIFLTYLMWDIIFIDYMTITYSISLFTFKFVSSKDTRFIFLDELFSFLTYTGILICISISMMFMYIRRFCHCIDINCHHLLNTLYSFFYCQCISYYTI